MFVSLFSSIKMENCAICQKSFKTRKCMLQHISQIHEKSTQVTCDQCSRVFTRKAALQRHLKTCKGEQASSSNSENVKRKLSQLNNSNKKTKLDTSTKHHVICALCNAGFLSKKLRDEHVVSSHDVTLLDTYNQYMPSYVTADRETMHCIENSLHLIMKQHNMETESKQLNFFRFTDLTFEDIEEHLAEVFRLHDEAFKLNISFGFIMTHIETGENQYFYPARNQTLLDKPVRITQSSDVSTLLQHLKDKDILEHVHQQRPNTKWRLTHITNVLYITYNLRHVIGSDVVLPNHLIQKKSLTCFVNNKNGKPYNDNLCMFRALMFHKHKSYKVERHIKQALEIWTSGTVSIKDFSGVKLEELPKFEEVFAINVNIYSLDENDKATAIYKSAGLHEDTLYLDKYLNHVSYINNFKAYANKFSCRKCQQFFDRSNNCNRHELICDDSTRLKYPGGFYSSKKNVFEQLMDLGIDVAEPDRYHREFCVYDFESMLVPHNQPAGPQTTILSKHVPISVSVCSTISQSPECHVSESSEDLVTFMMTYFNRIQQRVTRMMMERYKQVFDILEVYQSITKVRFSIIKHTTILSFLYLLVTYSKSCT